MIDGWVEAPIVTADTVYGAIGAYGPTSEIQPDTENEELLTLVREKANAICDDIIFDTLE